MCARPPFEVVCVSVVAREAKSAPAAAVPMEGFESQAQGGNPSLNRILNRYAPYRAQSARANDLSAEMLGLVSVQSDPAGLTQSPETSGASLATGGATGPESKPDRAVSMAPESLSMSSVPPETSARAPPSMSASSSGGCASSQARCATGSSACGSNSNNGSGNSKCSSNSGSGSDRTGGGFGSTRGGAECGGPEAAAAGNCARGDACCGGGSSDSKGCQGAGTPSHGCTPASEQGSTGSGSGQADDRLHQGLQGLRGHTAGLSGETATAAGAAGGPQRIRPSIARATVRRFVKRKAVEIDAPPSDANPPVGASAGAGQSAASPVGSGVPSTRPTFGDLEDLWRKDSEAKSYCSLVCSAPAMCRSGQEGVAGPTPEIPGMIVAESSRRKRMRTAAQENSMALLV